MTKYDVRAKGSKTVSGTAVKVDDGSYDVVTDTRDFCDGLVVEILDKRGGVTEAVLKGDAPEFVAFPSVQEGS